MGRRVVCAGLEGSPVSERGAARAGTPSASIAGRVRRTREPQPRARPPNESLGASRSTARSPSPHLTSMPEDGRPTRRCRISFVRRRSTLRLGDRVHGAAATATRHSRAPKTPRKKTESKARHPNSFLRHRNGLFSLANASTTAA